MGKPSKSQTVKLKIIRHNDTESAYDRTARNKGNLFFAKWKGRLISKTMKILKLESQNFEFYGSVDTDGQIDVALSVSEIYNQALEGDLWSPSILRIKRVEDKIHVIAAPECSLFDENIPDNEHYDEKGRLLEIVMLGAIKKITSELEFKVDLMTYS